MQESPGSGRAQEASVGTDRLKRIIESLLFASNEPLKPAEIREILSTEGRPAEGAIRKAVAQLREEYLRESRAFTIGEVAGGFRLETLPEYGDWIARLRAAPTRRRLSAPALETLAIIAYREPITKAEIEAIRGVNIDGVLENLADRDLVEPKGRKDAVGRPLLYGTTRRFLEHFGLNNLRDLPQIEELKRMPAAGAASPAPTSESPPGGERPLT